MSGNNLSLKDELLLLSSINKHRNSRLQKRSSYLKESSSVNDSNNKPCQLQSRDDDAYFEVDDNSVVTEQVSCYRRNSRNGGRPSSTLKSEALSTTESIRKATPEINNGRGRDSPETIRTEVVATPRRPDTSISQRHVNNYSPISIQTEMVSSRVQSNKHKKSIEKYQGTSGVVVEEKKKKTKQRDSNQDSLSSKPPIVKSPRSASSNKSDSSIRHVKKAPSVSSSSTKQKSKSRSFFTRRSKHTASREKKKKKKPSQTNSKGMQLELIMKPQQSSAMQRKISDRYLKSNVGRDIVSIKEEEEVVDKVLMKIPPNKVAVDTSTRETQTQEEVAIVVKQQNETSKKQLETEQQQPKIKAKVTNQKKQGVVEHKDDTQRKADIKVREQKEIEYRKCLETAFSVANMETKQAKRKEEELVKQLTQKIEQIKRQQAEAEIEKQRSIADELKRKETAEQLKQQIMHLETSLANQNKMLDKVELLMKDKMNTEEKLKKYQNELEQVKAVKVDMPDVSTSITPSSSTNKVENEHADLKREVERIVQAEILRVGTECTNELVEDDPDTSDEQSVETNLTTYTSYELEPSIVHDTSNYDSGGCFGWLCCAGEEGKLDKSSWYDASSVSDCSEEVGHEAHGSLGIRAV